LIDEDQAFTLLKRRIHLDRGLDCEQYKENYLKRRIAVRLRATGVEGYLAYMRLLKNNPEEYTRLLNELTVNVTQFFRDKDVFRRIRDEVVPALLESKKALGSRTVRIWSAGCASGEEPYSIAILVDHLGGDDPGWNFRVVGSDIDEKSLEVARKAQYSEVEVLEGIRLDDYFETSEAPSGKLYKVRDEIRRKVRVERMNILEEHPKRHFDMILCRNVLIYFGRDVQRRIIQNLSSDMLRDAYLVLGKSETLGHEAGAAFKPAFPRERIYQLLSLAEKGIAGGGHG